MFMYNEKKRKDKNDLTSFKRPTCENDSEEVLMNMWKETLHIIPKVKPDKRKVEIFTLKDKDEFEDLYKDYPYEDLMRQLPHEDLQIIGIRIVSDKMEEFLKSGCMQLGMRNYKGQESQVSIIYPEWKVISEQPNSSVVQIPEKNFERAKEWRIDHNFFIQITVPKNSKMHIIFRTKKYGA